MLPKDETAVLPMRWCNSVTKGMIQKCCHGNITNMLPKGWYNSVTKGIVKEYHQVCGVEQHCCQSYDT